MLLFQVTAASRALRHDDTAPASVPSTAMNAQVLTDAARNTPNIDHVWPTCATSSIVDIPVLCERRFDNMQLPETPAGWLAGDVGLGGRDEQDEGGRALIVVDEPRPFAHYCSYFLCLSRGVMTLTNNKIRKLSNGRHPESATLRPWITLNRDRNYVAALGSHDTLTLISRPKPSNAHGLATGEDHGSSHTM